MMLVLKSFTLCSLLIFAAGANNIGRFWHVTDFHYDNTYSKEDRSCNEPVAVHGQYGDYWCDSPWNLVQSAVDFIAKKTAEISDVDFVIWTGDTVSNIDNQHTDLDGNIVLIQNITDALKNALPGVPVYASLGNHDFYPDGQAPIGGHEIYNRVGDLWKGWMSDQSVVKRFKDGGFYSKTLPFAPNIRLLALNTNLWYTSNNLTGDYSDPADQFKWMEAQLKEAKAANQKVLVTGHVPPGLLTPGLVDWYFPAYQERFMDIIFAYSDVIAATHFGHDHSDGFKILQKNKEGKAVTQFTAPSVSPRRFKVILPSEILTDPPHNPGVRIVEYDRDTGAQLDYTQFYINLTDSNNAGQANWAKLYSFREAYDVQDMSVTSLRNIFRRMIIGKGKEYTDKFCRFGLVSASEKPCTDEMRGEIYCGGVRFDLDSANACLAGYMWATNIINGGSSLATNVGLIILGCLFVAHSKRW